MFRSLMAGACAPALLAALAAAPARAEDPPASAETVVVTGRGAPPRLDQVPTTAASVTAEAVRDTVNAVTVEDELKYLPSLFVRQRDFGDDQDPIATRTSGVGSSARSLIYADGVLLSALIGNNNTSASPHWQLVAPDAVERIDVLYGPFSAAYPGNSIGAVVEITTKTPTRLEAALEVQGAVQTFREYGDDISPGAARISASLGDRIGAFTFRTTYNHLDSDNQPLTYATVTIPTAISAAGTPATGYVLDANRTRAPVDVIGSTAIPHHSIDDLTTRLTYDLTPALTAAYTLGVFRNDEDDTDDTYLQDAAGNPVYAGVVNLGGRTATLANTVFSSGVAHLEEIQLAQGLSLTSHTGGVLDFDVTGTSFDTLKSRQRIPSGALPGAIDGGPGSTTSLDGTGWWTLDGKLTWRPFGADGAHVVTAGAHADRFKLNNPRYALSDWTDGSAGATQTFSRGVTETEAGWLQDRWTILPTLVATVGGRLEHWEASDGLNFSLSPALNQPQPQISATRFSPKGVLAWTPLAGFTVKASIGVANRFPTVQELYQSVTAGSILAVPNPNLKPEHALSSELQGAYAWRSGRVQLSLFSEDVDDALISQTGSLATGPNTTTAATFVQNVGHDRSRGAELVGAQDLPGRVTLSGWLTYVDSRITEDVAFPQAVGKQIPQLPRLRGAVVASWRPTSTLTATLAGRYSDRSFGAVDNSDTYADTYMGFGAYFVADAKLRWRVTPHVELDAGVNNLTDRSYFEYHPFPERTWVVGARWTL